MPNKLPEIVVSYLKSLQKQGIDTLHVDDNARLVLRNWMLAAKRGSQKADIKPPPQQEPIVSKAAPQGPQSSYEPGVIYQPGTIKKLLEEQEAEEKAKEQRLTQDESVEINLADGTLEEKLFALYSLANNWEPARSLGTLRDTMVFATGNPHSKIMLIGEAPGYHEELQKEPFVGRAGEKLNAILKAMGIERESLYISNIVKFRPAMPRQTTNNRPPSEKEIAASLPIITKEIELIAPKVIIALGATAAKGLLGVGQVPLSSLRGRFHDFKGVPVRVTYHPSYLLRTEELSERRKVWEDMLTVMELLNMPISDKQRSYFLPKR